MNSKFVCAAGGCEGGKRGVREEGRGLKEGGEGAREEGRGGG